MERLELAESLALYEYSDGLRVNIDANQETYLLCDRVAGAAGYCVPTVDRTFRTLGDHLASVFVLTSLWFDSRER